MKRFIIICIISLHFVFSGYSQWTQSRGIWGAKITSMLASDSAFFIGSFGDFVNKYQSGQPGWVSSDVYGFDLFKIGDVTFAQSWYNLYRTFDDGVTWEEVPIYPDNFIRATNEALFAPELYRSYDYGDTWEDIRQNIPYPDLQHYNLESWGDALFIEYFDENIILVSHDDGENWASLPTEGIPSGCWIIKFCIYNDGTWIGTDEGVYFLTEEGGEWQPVDTSAFDESLAFYIFHDTLWVASDQGCHYFNPLDSTWISQNQGLRYNRAYSFTEWHDTLFCSSYPGIYRRDPDRSWYLWNSEISQHRVQRIFANNEQVWVKTIFDDPYPRPWEYYLFRSDDNGVHFEELDSNLAINANDLIMTDSIYYMCSSDGFYISADEGNSWMPVNQGLDTLEIWDININVDYCYAITPLGLYWSENPPEVWELAPDYYSPYIVGKLAVNESVIICNAWEIDSESYSIRSENDGVNFDTICIDKNCNGLFFNALYRKPHFYQISSEPEIYYSGESGLSWEQISFPQQLNHDLSFDAESDYILIGGGLYQLNLFLSNNMGSEWIDISAGMPLSNSSQPLSTLEINENRIFAAIEYEGLWYRDDLLTGINQEDYPVNDVISVWPNPFTDSFIVEFNLINSPECRIELFDLSGRLILDRYLDESQVKRVIINNNTLPGIYILKVTSDDNCYTEKLVKTQ